MLFILGALVLSPSQLQFELGQPGLPQTRPPSVGACFLPGYITWASGMGRRSVREGRRARSPGGCRPVPPSLCAEVARPASQGQQGSPRNQSAFVDGSGSAVTYYVTSRSNRTSAVLYDGENGYVCYKPAEQRACYLRRMDSWDLQNLRMALNASEQGVDQPPLRNNQTKYYREFLGISARKPVDPKSLGEAVQNLCEETPIFWARRGEDPGRQRLIYLCIDICFPSNVCVSICFYYLPE
ncbi:BRICHOS domain-containing protein 5 isoform X1 [Rhea pennata]|uniref:BRICHOS domain-containing protein 5 isoform X1 n=1 Tax=Rhea pennata TaxID=8795 RepID=UPI002E267533